jgi:hypothetical protein
MSRRIFFTIIVLMFLVSFFIELFFAGYADEDNYYENYEQESAINKIKEEVSKWSGEHR